MLHAALIFHQPVFRGGRGQRVASGVWGKLALVVFVWLSLNHPGISQESRVRLRDGTTQAGHLQGTTAGQLIFSTKPKPIPLAAIRRVEFPSGSPVLDASSPARVFHLRGGGTITGELRNLNEDSIALHAHGQPITLPRRAVLAIDQPAGERQLFYEDFHADPLSAKWKTTGAFKTVKLDSRTALQIPPRGSCEYELPNPLQAGRCRIAFLEPDQNREAGSCGLELQFGDGKTTQSITIHLASQREHYTISHSPQWRLNAQRLGRKTGWSSATVLFDENRFQVLIGSRLLAYGRAPAGALHSVRLFSEETNTARDGKPALCGFDDFQITQRISKEDRPNTFALDSQSQILLENGDVVFGELIAVDSHQVQLKGAFGEATLPWGNVRRIVFGETPFPAHPITTEKPRTGWQADVKFQRFADHATQLGDELQVTLLGLRDGQLIMEHSRLGQIPVPVGHVDWIEPRFLGSRLVLASDIAHLGNQVRPKFRHRDPLGSSWHGEFELEELPEGTAFIRVRVSDLEPAGKDTPPGSRYLSELRNGFLGTAVVLNGESLGRLNDHLSRKRTLEDHQTVRLPVPSRLLRKGKNTWRIEQTSRRDDPKEYDDCEIGPVWLEIETE